MLDALLSKCYFEVTHGKLHKFWLIEKRHVVLCSKLELISVELAYHMLLASWIYVFLLWAIPSPYTFMAVGSAWELTHPINNCEAQCLLWEPMEMQKLEERKLRILILIKIITYNDTCPYRVRSWLQAMIYIPLGVQLSVQLRSMTTLEDHITLHGSPFRHKITFPS